MHKLRLLTKQTIIIKSIIFTIQNQWGFIKTLLVIKPHPNNINKVQFFRFTINTF